MNGILILSILNPYKYFHAVLVDFRFGKEFLFKLVLSILNQLTILSTKSWKFGIDHERTLKKYLIL